jgi:hypothetical protein
MVCCFWIFKYDLWYSDRHEDALQHWLYTVAQRPYLTQGKLVIDMC